MSQQLVSLGRASIQPGDTLGAFCQRNGMSRSEFFLANPHMEPHRRELPDGTWTANVLVGQVFDVARSLYPELAATPKDILPVDRAEYESGKACLLSGGIPAQGKCGKVEDGPNGKLVRWSDGTTRALSASDLLEIEDVLPVAKSCVEAGGLLNLSDDGSVKRCFKVGEYTDAAGNTQFVTFLDQPLDVEGTGEKKEEGMSTGAKWALGILGAIAVIGGGYFLMNRNSDSKGGYKSNPSPQSELQRLFALADSDTISQEALDDLSKNAEWGVRARVAYNPRTSTKTLKALVNDINPAVHGQAVDSLNARGVIATRRTFTQEELEREMKIQQEVEKNRPISPEELEIEKLHEKFRVADESTSEEILDALSYDEAWGVRARVAYNPNTSIETLQRLAKDSHDIVQKEAIESLKKKNGEDSSGGTMVSAHPPRGSQAWWNGLEWVFQTAKEAAVAEGQRSPRASDKAKGAVNAVVDVYDNQKDVINSAKWVGLGVYEHDGVFSIHMPLSSNAVGQARVMADVLNSYEVNSKARVIS